MRAWAAKYELRPLASLSAKAKSGVRQGALIKIEFRQKLVGYADLHPWVELGDEDLSTQLERLRQFVAVNKTAVIEPTRLLRRSLDLAKIDADARAKPVSCFRGLEIPQSHYLVTNLELMTDDQISRLKDEGFGTLKMKLGRDPASELMALAHLAPVLIANQMKLRLDFNASLTRETFSDFMGQLPPALLRVTEFIEDPVPFKALDWKGLQSQWKVPLALDQMSPETINELNAEGGASPKKSFRWIVAKTARFNPHWVSVLAARLGAELCVTSYLDHPVGQVGAALEAAWLLQLGVELGTCGFLSHKVYEPNEFSEQLAKQGPAFEVPSGTGIGFDDLLEKQNWQELK